MTTVNVHKAEHSIGGGLKSERLPTVEPSRRSLVCGVPQTDQTGHLPASEDLSTLTRFEKSHRPLHFTSHVCPARVPARSVIVSSKDLLGNESVQWLEDPLQARPL